MIFAEKYKIPYISLHLSPAYVTQIDIHNRILGNEMLTIQNALRAKITLEPLLSWKTGIENIPCNLGLWPEWFHPDTHFWPIKVDTVGFPTPIKHSDNNPNMVSKKPRILITGGTSAFLHTEFYKKCIVALGGMDLDVTLLCKYKKFLPSTALPENITHISFLQLNKVLKEYDCVIHHGGIGTTSECTLMSIPQLVLGHYTDRGVNGSMVEENGLGYYLPLSKWKHSEIKNAVNKCLNMNISKENSGLSPLFHETVKSAFLHPEKYQIKNRKRTQEKNQPASKDINHEQKRLLLRKIASKKTGLKQ